MRRRGEERTSPGELNVEKKEGRDRDRENEHEIFLLTLPNVNSALFSVLTHFSISMFHLHLSSFTLPPSSFSLHPFIPKRWRAFFDSDEPHRHTLPAPFHETLNPLAKLCVLRCWRPDKIMDGMQVGGWVKNRVREGRKRDE